MIVNAQVLDLAFKGFNTVVNDAMMQAPAHAKDIAMTVPSVSRDETYGWLGSFPAMREWLIALSYAANEWMTWLMVPQFGMGIVFAFLLTTLCLFVLSWKRP